MIYITSSESEDLQLGPPMSEPSPVMLKIAKAERGELTEKEMKDLVEFLKTREEVMRLGSQLGGGGSVTTEEPVKRSCSDDGRIEAEQGARRAPDQRNAGADGNAERGENGQETR